MGILRGSDAKKGILMFCSPKSLRNQGDPAREVSPCIILKGRKCGKAEKRGDVGVAAGEDVQI